MMNNSIYRVKIHISGSSENPCLVFNHPVSPVLFGGWMAKEEQEEQQVKAGGANTLRKFTKEDVRKHNKVDDLWIVISGEVYDVTPYINGNVVTFYFY